MMRSKVSHPSYSFSPIFLSQQLVDRHMMMGRVRLEVKINDRTMWEWNGQLFNYKVDAAYHRCDKIRVRFPQALCCNDV